MQNFKVGDLVTVTFVSTVDFVEFPKLGMDGAKKGVIDQPLEWPIIAAIIGKVTKYTGAYYPASRTSGWWGEDDQPARLSVDGSVTFWQVRHGWLNKPLLVRDELVKPYKGEFEMPRMAPRPKYAEPEPVDPTIRTDSELASIRRKSADYLVNKIGYDSETLKFTCDDCAVKNECRFAFDAYNTNGDCLALK